MKLNEFVTLEDYRQYMPKASGTALLQRLEAQGIYGEVSFEALFRYKGDQEFKAIAQKANKRGRK